MTDSIEKKAKTHCAVISFEPLMVDLPIVRSS